jgi:hypothetical protein
VRADRDALLRQLLQRSDLIIRDRRWHLTDSDNPNDTAGRHHSVLLG